MILCHQCAYDKTHPITNCPICREETNVGEYVVLRGVEDGREDGDEVRWGGGWWCCMCFVMYEWYDYVVYMSVIV